MKGRAQVVSWDDTKDNPPGDLKIPNIVMVLNKSRKFRAILNLSYTIKLMKHRIEYINDTNTKTVKIKMESYVQSKKMYNNGLWRCVAEEGQEWNFTYVVPQEEGEISKVVVTTSPQIGWIESSSYFCASSGTGQEDVGEEYAQSKIGTLPDHIFLKYTKGSPEY